MLEIKNLSIHFTDRGQDEHVVKEISFSMGPNEILGIVGESGSGKTMTALTIAGLIKEHAVLESGQILLDGVNLLDLDKRAWRRYQGDEISMIFQEPMTALNPTMKVGKQIEETLILHTRLSKAERLEKVYKVMEDVELENPAEMYHKYPHELSGGMRQRIMIASAVVCRPKVLIADEPTTALDVHTQEHILKLLKKLNKKYEMGILFISHNLRVVKCLCERVLVMKEGEIIESGRAEDIFSNPREEYTKELIAAIPARTKENTYYELFMQKAGETNA